MKTNAQDTCCSSDSRHPDHSKHLGRVSRIVGQLEGVKKMISEGRYCVDILTQTRAASSAIASLEAEILQSHLDTCVKQAFLSKDEEDSQKKIAELKTIFRKFG